MMGGDTPLNRPSSVTFLAVAAFFFALWNGLRLGEAVYLWKTLLEYGAHPMVLALSGAFWFVAGIFLAVSLWLGKRWTLWAAGFTILGYAAWYWFERLFLETPHANLLFSIITTGFLLFIFLVILFSRRNRDYFQRDHHAR
jgi:hypothetical protein